MVLPENIWRANIFKDLGIMKVKLFQAVMKMPTMSSPRTSIGPASGLSGGRASSASPAGSSSMSGRSAKVFAARRTGASWTEIAGDAKVDGALLAQEQHRRVARQRVDEREHHDQHHRKPHRDRAPRATDRMGKAGHVRASQT